MTKKTYGPKVEARARRLLEVLVRFANHELNENQTLDIRCNWLSQRNHRPRLMVKTRLDALAELTQQDRNGVSLSKEQVREALGRMEDYLEILEDHRLLKRGVAQWHFTLTLWSKQTDENLAQLARIWDEKRPPKSKQELERKLSDADSSESSSQLSPHSNQSVLSPIRTNQDNRVAVPNNLPRSGAIAFVGRERELERLHHILSSATAGKTVAIVGMGGLGKTELALQYALKRQSAYAGGVCWFRGRGIDLGSQIIGLAQEQLGVSPPDDWEWTRQVAYCWGQFPPGDVLVIVDDLADYQEIKPYLPPAVARFRVLLTSRGKLGRGIERFSLAVLSQAAALELFSNAVGKERVEPELARTEELCKWLGYLPLGLELVGRYLERRPDWSLARMQERLENKRLQAKALCRTNKDDEMTAQLGVAAAFELSWETLSPEAQQLGGLLSVFAAAPILWSWVEQCDSEIDPEDLEEIRDESLLDWHLLRRVESGTYQLHPLIREFFQSKLNSSDPEGESQQKVCRVLVALAREIPKTPTRERIEAVAAVIPHLVEVATVLVERLDDGDLMQPFVGLGRFYEGRGSYEKALPWRERCLSVVCDRFGREHSDVADSLSSLAALYRSQGRYEKAEPLCVEALEMRKKLFGQEHLDVADSLSSLACLYYSQGKYEKAETLFLQALEMRKKFLGSEHSIVVKNRENLAGLYALQGKYEEAEPMFLEVLDMNKKLFGSEHLKIAITLNNLAAFYSRQGKDKVTESLLIEALEMRKKLLGSEHPDVAMSLNNLAVLYRSKGELGKAEPLLVEALEIRKIRLGSEHPDVAGSLHNVACLYKHQKKYKAAESLFIEALEMRKKLLGLEHPYVAETLHCMGCLYKSKRKYIESESLYIEALEMRKRLLGGEHPKVAMSLNDLAKLYKSQKKYEEAEFLYIKALEMRENLLGLEHPDVAKVLNELVALYPLKWRDEETNDCLVKALEEKNKLLERKRLLGSEHPDVADSLHSEACLYRYQEKYKDAESLFIEALEMRKKLLGLEHPDVAQSLHCMACLCKSQKRYKESEILYVEALNIRKKVFGIEHPEVARSLKI